MGRDSWRRSARTAAACAVSAVAIASALVGCGASAGLSSTSGESSSSRPDASGGNGATDPASASVIADVLSRPDGGAAGAAACTVTPDAWFERKRNGGDASSESRQQAGPTPQHPDRVAAVTGEEVLALLELAAEGGARGSDAAEALGSGRAWLCGYSAGGAFELWAWVDAAADAHPKRHDIGLIDVESGQPVRF